MFFGEKLGKIGTQAYREGVKADREKQTKTIKRWVEIEREGMDKRESLKRNYKAETKPGDLWGEGN